MKAFILLIVMIPTIPWAVPRTYSEILKSKELRICYAPWMGKDSVKDYESPYLELAEAFAKSKHLKSKITKIIWDDQFKNKDGQIHEGETYQPELFDSQKCDVFSNSLSPLLWRLKLMDMNWLFTNTFVIVVRKEDAPNYKSIDDLKSKSTVVVPKTTFQEWLLDLQGHQKNGEKIKITEVPQGGTVSYLLNKTADFIVLGIHQAMYSKLHLTDGITIAFAAGNPAQTGWGFPKDRQDFVAETTKFFESERKVLDSEVNKIYKKYFGFGVNDYDGLHNLILSK